MVKEDAVPSYIAFLRAVNVGGRQLKMAEARAVLQENGFADVQSHIQTGNLLVSSPLRSVAKVEQAVGAALAAHTGFEVVAIVRRPAELTDLVEAVDGIPEQVEGETTRYVSFCAAPPTRARVEELHAWEPAGEQATVIGKDVLMEFAVPFHEAKLTGARIEKILGIPGTARNLKVVRTLAEKWGTA